MHDFEELDLSAVMDPAFKFPTAPPAEVEDSYSITRFSAIWKTRMENHHTDTLYWCTHTGNLVHAHCMLIRTNEPVLEKF